MARLRVMERRGRRRWARRWVGGVGMLVVVLVSGWVVVVVVLVEGGVGERWMGWNE